MTRLQKILWAIAVSVVITLGFLLFKTSEVLTLTKTQVNSLTDTVTITRNKLNQEIAKRSAIAGSLSSVSAQLKIQKADPELQELAKDKGNIAGVIRTTQVRIDTISKITNTSIGKVIPDTVTSDSTPRHYENFTQNITNQWYTLDINKTNDSLRTQLVVNGKSVGSFTKKGDSYVFVNKELNPYIHTVDQQSYIITPDPVHKGKYFLWGGVAGVAASVLLKVFVIK